MKLFTRMILMIGIFACASASATTIGGKDRGHVVHYGGKCMTPYLLQLTPGTEIVLHSDNCMRAGELGDELHFEYQRQNGGRLKHTLSGMCLMPADHGTDPRDGTRVILGDCTSDVAQFYFYRNTSLRHRGGKCIQVDVGRGEQDNPRNNARLILHEGCLGTRLAFEISTPTAGVSATKGGGSTRLIHSFSGLCVVPEDFATADDTRLVLVNYGCETPLKARNFRMLAHGEIQHIESKKCIYPKGNWNFRPPTNAELVLRGGCDKWHKTTSDKFAFRRLSNGAMQHKLSGRCIHPSYEHLLPEPGTELRLDDECGEGRRIGFEFITIR